MKNEFVLAFNEVIEDKQLPREVVMEALQAAMVSAYRKAVNASNAQHIVANIDSDTGEVSIFAEKEVVETVQDARTEVSIDIAQMTDQDAEIGGIVIVESTPENFGRVAAQTARQVIQQRIREAERAAQYEHFINQVGEVVNGVVQSVSSQHITIGMDKRAEGIMPRKEQISRERFRVHDRVRALLLEVKQTPRGPQIILSRSHRNFLRRLLEDEVPEIYHGLVEIRAIAREPGHRSKVAVAALQAGIDPVGACVGIRGVRIQAIVRELNDEKIDVIEWNPDPAIYIAKALSPARVTGVYLDEHAKGTKTATVVVPEDQLSLAIGRDGQNARLAAKLASWRIDIKSLPEAAADALHKLQTNPEYAPFAEGEAEVVPLVEAILTKKSEGRAVTPEEYQSLSQFLDRVERGVILQRQTEVLAEKQHMEVVRASIPEAAFDIPLDELGLSPRWVILLSGAGYSSIGDLQFQYSLDPDVILKLNGIGPKAMEEIQTKLETFELPAPPEEEVVGAPIEVEAPEAVVAPEVVEAEEAIEVAPVAAVEAAEPVEALADVEVPEEIVAEEVSVAEPVEIGEPAIDAEPPEVLEPEEPEVVAEAEPTPVDEEELSFDELFALKPEILKYDEALDEEDDEVEDKKGQKKRKRKRYIEMEYDPDQDVMVVRRKRKRGQDEWLDDWEME